MINVLKNALIYTGVYFLLVTVIFWAAFFIHVALLVFWKAMVAVFLIIFAVFTFDYFKKRNTVGTLESVQQLRDVMRNAKAKHGWHA